MNNVLNGGMLNPNLHKIIENDLCFGLIFLTYWFDGKLESITCLYYVYQVYPEFTKNSKLINL